MVNIFQARFTHTLILFSIQIVSCYEARDLWAVPGFQIFFFLKIQPDSQMVSVATLCPRNAILFSPKQWINYLTPLGGFLISYLHCSWAGILKMYI